MRSIKDQIKNNIQEKIKNHIPGISGFELAKKSAVCIPLIKNNDDSYKVLFEVRSSGLDAQPQDICLPGGMLEKDEKPMEAAVREIREELLISENQLSFLGRGDMLYMGNLIIHTFAFELFDYDYRFNEESEEVFCVPLDFFINTEPEEYIIERNVVIPDNFPFDRIHGGRNYRWRSNRSSTYFYRWENRDIWGITAKIMKDFTKILRA